MKVAHGESLAGHAPQEISNLSNVLLTSCLSDTAGGIMGKFRGRTDHEQQQTTMEDDWYGQDAIGQEGGRGSTRICTGIIIIIIIITGPRITKRA
jgi:hypothetical protein